MALFAPGTAAYGLLHAAGGAMHRRLATSAPAARAYFATWPLLRWLPAELKGRLQNSAASVRWPELSLPPQTVTVGQRTRITIRPHPGEADIAALLHSTMPYEHEVYSWLEDHVHDYDTVVEVGANVGLFSAFFATCQRRVAGAVRPRVVAFEPSVSAFARLVDNLALNPGHVLAYNCGVSDQTGVSEFFEPADHLTNGSLRESFARIFSDEVAATRIVVLDSRMVEQLVPAPGRMLLKIDVEGAEDLVLAGLRPWIEACRPDLLLEVLPAYAERLQQADYLAPLGYRFHRLEDSGPVPVEPYAPHPRHRDHLIVAPARSSARTSEC